jgi:flagellar hook protein FlgE
MSLTSSLYSGISGLSATGDSMQIIGDNLSNTNTTGFKSAAYSFEDLLSQSISTQSGTSQIGRGTALSDISTDWSQGSFATTGNSTDLAISGDGFFIVRDADSESTYYTRAGEFSFDDDGNLVNSTGYVVQGWELNDDGEAVGAVADITLEAWTSPPQESSEATLIVNLDVDADDNTTAAAGGLESAWDGSDADGDGMYIDSEAYEYQTSVTVYDSLGNTHDVTVYFDQTGTDGTWEYIITCDPEEDARTAAAGVTLGLLATGTVDFSTSSGEITGMDMFDGITGAAAVYDSGTSGYLQFTADFLGDATGATEMQVSLNLGTRYDGLSWANEGESTTQYASESATTYQTADGYGAGALESIDVGTDGTITGSYSNGATIPLYQIALADFVSVDGLKKLGGSLYAETSESGAATTNFPGTSGLGSISPNSLEQSNVDIASEFVKMIQIQRSYQANSKIITTVDDMLSNTINMKR